MLQKNLKIIFTLVIFFSIRTYLNESNFINIITRPQDNPDPAKNSTTIGVDHAVVVKQRTTNDESELKKTDDSVIAREYDSQAEDAKLKKNKTFTDDTNEVNTTQPTTATNGGVSEVATALVEGSSNGVNTSTLFHRPYPHAGARDEFGNFGYVVDPSPKRLVKSDSLGQIIEKSCLSSPDETEGMGGNQVLRKIQKGLMDVHQHSNVSSYKPRIRILCLVYTHSGRDEELQSIVDTWATDCDGFIAASNITNSRLGSVDILHLGNEGYKNMWQKVRSMWAYAYDNYLNDYDYFHACGDDTFMIMDHLRYYLGGEDVQKILNGTKVVFSRMQEPPGVGQTKHFTDAMKKWHGRPEDRPLLFGMPHERNGRVKIQGRGVYFQTFPGGGCGYTLNQQALKLFGEKILPNCLTNATDSREDVFMGGCMASHGIHTVDTRDSEGAWVYMSQNAEHHIQYDGGRAATWGPSVLKSKHGIESLPGLQGISKHGVAFHLRLDKRSHLSSTVPLMHRYYAIINNKC